MKSTVRYAFPLIWLLTGPSLLWFFVTHGVNFIRITDVVLVNLSIVGTVGSLLRFPPMRLIAGGAGVLLGLVNLYFVWGLGGFGNSSGWTFGYHFFGMTIKGWPASVFALANNLSLIVLSGAAAWLAADELDRNMEAKPAPSVSP